MADLPDLVLHHEYVIAFEQFFALDVKDVDILEQRHFRWNVSRCRGEA